MSENVETRVAIVGGGLDGLALALHLADAGIAPIVIEAGDICSGAAAASAGIVAPQLVRNTPNGVAKRMGAAPAARLLNMLAESGSYCFSLIGADRERCGASGAGFIAPSFGASGQHNAAAIVEQWRPFRSDLRAIGAEEVGRLTGTRGYGSALLDPSGGSLDPIAYGDLLAEKAEGLGARIFTDSQAGSIERRDGKWRVGTAHGSVAADTVILCANGGNPDLRRELRRTVLPLRVCQVATRPLSDEVRRSILPQGHALTDTEADVFSIRFDREGRLITAHPMSRELESPERLHRVINERLAAALPSYSAGPLEFAWSGVAWLNSNLLPRAVEVADGMFALQACNGRGIALSGVIGREFGRWIAGDRTEPCALPIERPRPIRGYFLAQSAPKLIMRTSLLAQRLRRAFPAGRNNG